MGKEKITVTALTSGSNDASARFRIRQYSEVLACEGIEVRDYCPFIDKNVQLPQSLSGLNRLARAPFAGALLSLKLMSRLPGLLHSFTTDVVWINRQLNPGRKTFECLTGGVRVFDVDDSIWMGGDKSVTSLQNTLKNIDIVFAGNSFLADWFSQYCEKVYIIPTGIDVEKFFPAEKKICDDFVIGWTGSRHTIQYLYQIESTIQHFFDLIPEAKLLVVSDCVPIFSRLSRDRIKYVEWRPEIEASILRDMDVGIMPLPDDEWSRGKCSFKMLQYMATGLPVVVSPVGMNKDVLELDDVGYGAKSESEWIDALSLLHTDRGICNKLGMNGTAVIREHFSVQRIACKIASIFKGAVIE